MGVQACLGDTPIMIEADIGYLKYGTENHREYFNDTIPEISLDVKTTNNILMLHGFARVQPQQGPVRPYFEGLYGFKYLFTRTSIIDNWYDEPIASSTNYSDLAGSWGLGAGVDLRLWNGPKQSTGRGVCDISLNLSGRRVSCFLIISNLSFFDINWGSSIARHRFPIQGILKLLGGGGGAIGGGWL
jgi:hypothetical protein